MKKTLLTIKILKNITKYQEKSFTNISRKNDNLKFINMKEKDKIIKNESGNNKLQIDSFCFSFGNLTNESNFKIVVIDDHKFVRDSIVNLIKKVLKLL